MSILASTPVFVARLGIQILFGSLYNQPSYGGVSFDVVMSESHSYNNQVSSYPIQSGSTIIDNVIKTPTIISMDALISDTPYRLFENAIETLSRIRDTVFSGSVGLRSITALEALIKLQESRQPFTLVTGIKVYNNMVLTKLVAHRDNRTGQMLRFRLEFQEVMLSVVQLAVQLFSDTTIASSIKYQQLFGDPPTCLKEQFARASAYGGVKLTALNPFKNGAVTSLFKVVNKFLGF